MAYMHESVHICHVGCPFFMHLPYTESYPSIFILGAVAKAPAKKLWLNFSAEKSPVTNKMDKKFYMEKFYLMIKFFWKLFTMNFFTTGHDSRLGNIISMNQKSQRLFLRNKIFMG